MYNYGTEYYFPYFVHMEQLQIGLVKMDMSKSGICHHMMFETKYVSEIIHKVESIFREQFYIVFLKLATEIDGSGASEYEIYFNYMLKYHSDKIIIRKLNWNNVHSIEDAQENMDYVSCHWYIR
jgi:hypothetical protein